MPTQIRDGRGRGYLVSVNSDQQLITRSTVVEQRLTSALDQNYYEATTAKVTLSDAVDTGIIYIKNENQQEMDIVIDRVFYDLWTSTDGSGADGTLKYYVNPTIVGGTDIVPLNTNFTSSTAAVGTFKKSLTSVSGTAWWTAYVTDKTSVELEEGRIVLPNGASFAISVAAPTGNTSMDIAVNIAFYYIDPSLVE